MARRLGRRPPGAIRRTIRTGQHYHVSVRIPEPNLPMIGSALAFRRIPMTGQDDFNPHAFGSPDRCLEVLDFKPQQHPVAVRFQLRVTDRTMVMIDLPMVQLQNQFSLRLQAFVIGSTVGTLATQQALVPATGCLDIVRADEWLWSHCFYLERFPPREQPKAWANYLAPGPEARGRLTGSKKGGRDIAPMFPAPAPQKSQLRTPPGWCGRIRSPPTC